MHEDLRRRALESKKTVSKKAKSKQSSGASSAANSRPTSRGASAVASRDVSDDEDADFSDETSWSVASIDGVLSGNEEDQIVSWGDELATRVPRIIDRNRKGGSVQGREEDIAVYVHILRAHYAHQQISSQATDLLSAFSRYIKAESSEKETTLALKAIAITILTDPVDDGAALELLDDPLRSVISASKYDSAKVEAIHTLATVAFFSGTSFDDNEDIMAFFLEIIESDGEFVSSPDNGEVVTAALEAWGFLATQQEDMEHSTPVAVEAFMEQLDSSDPRVTIASGEDIALLFEKSFTDIESDEDISDSEFDRDSGAPRPTVKQRYEPFNRKDLLLQKLSDLAKVSHKGLSKKSRKSLHTNFADISQSVQNPTLGPQYSSALDMDGRYYGSRLKIRLSKKASMRIDKWWKLFRLRALRRILQGGFLQHYEMNQVVLETLPVLTS